MKKPQDYLKEVKSSEEFAKIGADVSTFFNEHASRQVRTNAVKYVIGEMPLSAIDTDDVANQCKKVYGWNVSPIAVNHYLSILRHDQNAVVPRPCGHRHRSDTRY